MIIYFHTKALQWEHRSLKIWEEQMALEKP